MLPMSNLYHLNDKKIIFYLVYDSVYILSNPVSLLP